MQDGLVPKHKVDVSSDGLQNFAESCKFALGETAVPYKRWMASCPPVDAVMSRCLSVTSEGWAGMRSGEVWSAYHMEVCSRQNVRVGLVFSVYHSTGLGGEDS